MGLLKQLGKTVQELIDAGYPESVAARIASGELPMDNASRMGRAVQQDYDPTDVQYHGSASDIKEFIPSKNGALSSGVYTTSSPELASEYAGLESGSVVYPLLTRKGAGNISRDEYLARNRYATIADLPQLNSNLRNIENITGIDDVATSNVASRGDEAIRNTFDPRDIRSVNAAFDPEYKGSNILGAAATMGTTGLLGATAMAPSESQAGDQVAAEMTDQDRYAADVQRAQQMAQSDDPAMQQRGQAWLDQFGGMASEDDSEPFDANYNNIDEMLWLAQSGETFLRDIGGAVSGMFDPETGRQIRENRTLPATEGTDYLDQQLYGALGAVLQPIASGLKRVGDMPYNAYTVQMAANPYAMPIPSLEMQQDTTTLNDAIGFAAQEYDKLSDRQKRNIARAGNAVETASYIVPGMGLLKKVFGGAN